MNTLPHFASLDSALTSLYGTAVAVAHRERVSGGDINKAFALTLTNGERIFMKANARERAAFFTAEAAGLSALAATRVVRTPRILCTGTDDSDGAGYSFLLLEYVASATMRADYWERFAEELAALHRAPTADILPELASGDRARFGFFQHNFIGASRQLNTPAASWLAFFRESRLAPQFAAADRYFSAADRARHTRLLDHLDDFLQEPAVPSLLHGDLWAGNVLCGADGAAWLIDPATYVGHAEADLAMTELFGGFPRRFYDAYRAVLPPAAGYERRRNLYNLYQLLNHLNLFGAGYLGAVRSVVAEYVGSTQ